MDSIFSPGARHLSHTPPEVAALMATLQHNRADSRRLRQFGDDQWNKLLAFTDLAHMTLPLVQLDWKGFPQWVMERLEGNLASNALRFERVKKTYQEAATALLKGDVEHVVLKGFTQFPHFVCDPRLRAQSDLDFYIPPAAMNRAQEAMQSIGYRMEETVDYSRADHLPTFIRPGEWHWRGNAFDPDMPLSIELHFVLWNERVARLSVPEVDLFWKRRISRAIDDMLFPSLTPVDHLGYLTLHILRNMFAGNSVLNHVNELSGFLHHHADDDAFWEEWRETHGPRLRLFETVAIYQARAWFDCNLHESLEQQVATVPAPIANWLDRFAASSFNGMFVQNKDYLWLHVAFLDSFKEKGRLILRSLIAMKVPRRNNPLIQLKDRQLRALRLIHTRLPYLSYVLSRLASRMRVAPEMLVSGIAWWLSQRQLKQKS